MPNIIDLIEKKLRKIGDEEGSAGEYIRDMCLVVTRGMSKGSKEDLTAVKLSCAEAIGLLLVLVHPDRRIEAVREIEEFALKRAEEITQILNVIGDRNDQIRPN
jgi:hypothetical protein